MKNTLSAGARLGLLFFTFLSVFVLSSQAQGGKCFKQTLRPYLFAEMCLPTGASFRNGPEKIVCDDYHLVGFSIQFPGGSIEVNELPKCAVEALRRTYDKTVSQGKNGDWKVHHKTDKLVVLQGEDGKWEVHGFRNPGGWPYHLKAEVKGEESKMEFIEKCISSLDFGIPDAEF